MLSDDASDASASSGPCIAEWPVSVEVMDVGACAAACGGRMVEAFGVEFAAGEGSRADWPSDGVMLASSSGLDVAGLVSFSVGGAASVGCAGPAVFAV